MLRFMQKERTNIVPFHWILSCAWIATKQKKKWHAHVCWNWKFHYMQMWNVIDFSCAFLVLSLSFLFHLKIGKSTSRKVIYKFSEHLWGSTWILFFLFSLNGNQTIEVVSLVSFLFHTYGQFGDTMKNFSIRFNNKLNV